MHFSYRPPFGGNSNKSRYYFTLFNKKTLTAASGFPRCTRDGNYLALWLGESHAERLEKRKVRPLACFFVFHPFARASSALWT